MRSNRPRPQGTCSILWLHGGPLRARASGLTTEEPVGRHRAQRAEQPSTWGLAWPSGGQPVGASPAFPRGQLQTPELAKFQKGISAPAEGWPVCLQDEVQLLSQDSTPCIADGRGQAANYQIKILVCSIEAMTESSQCRHFPISQQPESPTKLLEGRPLCLSL